MTESSIEIGGFHFRVSEPHDKDFLRDLREIPLWEGDKVLYSPVDRGEKFPQELIIVDLDYSLYLPNRPSSFPRGHPYRVASDFNSSPSYHAAADELRLVEHGNIWRYYNNEPLSFKDLGEETRFFKIIGHYKELANPKTDLFQWEIDEILEFITKGTAHGMMGTTNELWISPDDIPTDLPKKIGFRQICAVRFDDENLGKRVADATIANFTKSDRQNHQANVQNKSL